MTKLLLPCFSGSTLQGIGSLDIQRCLTYLRTEHKNQHGKPLTPKTLHHLYNTLNLIFGFAEKQELLVKNPMKLVDSPKKEKKPVDALTEEQAKKFFSLLPDTPLDFHCILQLLIGIVKECAVGKHPKSEKLGGIGSGCRLRLRPLPVLRRRQSQRVARIDPNAVVVDKNIAENDRFDLFSR